MQLIHSIFILAMIGDLGMLPEAAFTGAATAGKDVTEIQHGSKPIIAIGTSASPVPLSPVVTPKWTPPPTMPSWYSEQRKARFLQSEVRIPSASVPNSPLRTVAKPGASTPARKPDLPDKNYWLPYKLRNTNRFEEVDKLQPTRMSKLVNKVLFRDQNALNLFKKSYPKVSNEEGKVHIVQEALDYLFKKNKISDEELNAWTKQLIQIGTQDRRIISEFHSSLFYGLHTLRLKYYDNVQLTQALAQAMKSFTSDFRRSASTPWEKALFNPGVGRHSTFQKEWDKIITSTNYREMKEAIRAPPGPGEDKGAGRLKHYIETRFSKENMGKYTSQNRIMVLALLHNFAQSADLARRKPAIELAWLLEQNKEGMSLFNHEKILVQNILWESHTKTDKLMSDFRDIRFKTPDNIEKRINRYIENPNPQPNHNP